MIPDTTQPTISLVTLLSDSPNNLFATNASVLTLQFTVADETALTGGAQPPASFAVTVGPAGSSAPVFVSAQDVTFTSGRFIYSWIVPNSPGYTSVGYSISVADAAGNTRTATAANVITLGKRGSILHAYWLV